MFRYFCLRIESFEDCEIKNIILRMVSLLEIEKSDDVKKNWEKVFHQILG